MDPNAFENVINRSQKTMVDDETCSWYRKMPVDVKAWKYTPKTAMDIYQWIERNTQGSFDLLDDELPGSGVSIDPADGLLVIATLEGVMKVSLGDYVIRGVEGEFYPCKAGIFEMTHVKV